MLYTSGALRLGRRRVDG